MTEVGAVTVTGRSALQCVVEVLKLELRPALTRHRGMEDRIVLEKILKLRTVIRILAMVRSVTVVNTDYERRQSCSFCHLIQWKSFSAQNYYKILLDYFLSIECRI